MKSIPWKEFEAVELMVGVVIEVKNFPEARNPAYKLTVDFGPEIGIKNTSAQITENYTKEALPGR